MAARAISICSLLSRVGVIHLLLDVIINEIINEPVLSRSSIFWLDSSTVTVFVFVSCDMPSLFMVGDGITFVATIVESRLSVFLSSNCMSNEPPTGKPLVQVTISLALSILDNSGRSLNETVSPETSPSILNSNGTKYPYPIKSESVLEMVATDEVLSATSETNNRLSGEDCISGEICLLSKCCSTLSREVHIVLYYQDAQCYSLRRPKTYCRHWR